MSSPLWFLGSMHLGLRVLGVDALGLWGEAHSSGGKGVGTILYRILGKSLLFEFQLLIHKMGLLPLRLLCYQEVPESK